MISECLKNSLLYVYSLSVHRVVLMVFYIGYTLYELFTLGPYAVYSRGTQYAKVSPGVAVKCLTIGLYD